MMEIFFFLGVAIKKLKRNIVQSEPTENSSILASESTIHGFQLIFDQNRSSTVKIFWISIFTISSIFCLINAHGNYIKLRIKPEIEEISTQKLIQEIPFPAVKLCSEIFGKNSIKLLHNFINGTKLTIIKKYSNDLVTSAHLYSPDLVKVTFTSTSNSEKSSERFDLVSYVNQTFYETDEVLFDCEIFGRKQQKCSKIFKRILSKFGRGTSSGFCYVFNQENFHSIFEEEISKDFDSNGKGVFEKSQWTLDGGYKNSEENAFPIRASIENELVVNVKILREIASNFPGQIFFSFYFQMPNDLTSNSIDFVIKDKMQKTFTISAKVSTYSEDFRKFSPENRGCYFTDERKLKFFKSYTENNCLEECLSNYTLKMCNCTGFYMIRKDSTPICIMDDESTCYYRGKQKFPSKNLGNPPCGCLKTCNDIEYKVINEKTETYLGHLSHNSEYFVSRVKFKFLEPLIAEDVHVVGYHLKDFMTDVGGLLGLFLGCSTVSVVEIFYHPLRILLNKFKKKKVQNDPENEIEENFEEEISSDDEENFGGLQIIYNPEIHGETSNANLRRIKEEELKKYFG